MNSPSERGPVARAPRRAAGAMRDAGAPPDARRFAVVRGATAFVVRTFVPIARFLAAGFFATGFFATRFFATGFFDAGFFDAGFFAAPCFRADDLADAAFFAPGFAAAGFLFAVVFAAGFLAACFFVVLIARTPPPGR